jgi:excisionase family DNA binding protein
MRGVGEIESALKKMVEEAVGERLPGLIAEGLAKAWAQPGEARSPLVDIRRACEFLRISETKLRGMCRAGSIPFHKVDGSYRFDLNELHEATKSRRD